MMNPNGKKLILWFLSLILCITACAPAFSSTGDRVLVHRSNTDESIYFYIESVFPNGNGLYVMVQEGNEHKILRYADVNAEPEAFTLDERLLHGGGGDDIFTFCENWGTDTVEQLADGSVLLWFASGSEENWDESTLTYTD